MRGECFSTKTALTCCLSWSLKRLSSQRLHPHYSPSRSRAGLRMAGTLQSGLAHASGRGGPPWQPHARRLTFRPEGSPPSVPPSVKDTVGWTWIRPGAVRKAQTAQEAAPAVRGGRACAPMQCDDLAVQLVRLVLRLRLVVRQLPRQLRRQVRPQRALYLKPGANPPNPRHRRSAAASSAESPPSASVGGEGGLTAGAVGAVRGQPPQPGGGGGGDEVGEWGL